MEHAPVAILKEWENFYVIIGSAAAALTGLVFVVITIVTGSNRARRSREGTAAFTTPTVVHFGAALFVSAVLSIPWPSLHGAATILALAGLFGVVYVVLIAYRIRRMSTYDADMEDWTWHTLLPVLAYGALAAGAFAPATLAPQTMFAFAFAVLALIFVGIHNAWDIVTFVAVGDTEPSTPESPKSDSSQRDAAQSVENQ